MSNPGFRYTDFFTENMASARKIVPVLFSIMPAPRRVVDLGGGTGAWCTVFREHGAASVVCIDDPRIPREQLLVRPEEFVSCDLSRDLPAPVPSDLAMSLEVAEHLPEAMAPRVVEFLTASANVVLFSAAIPGQPHGAHINEQPPAYWRQLFRDRGFERYDLLRPRIIQDTEISYWYRQNLYLFANPAGAATFKQTCATFPSLPDDFELIHCRVLETTRARRRQPGLRRFLAGLVPALRTSLAARRQREEGA